MPKIERRRLMKAWGLLMEEERDLRGQSESIAKRLAEVMDSRKGLGSLLNLTETETETETVPVKNPVKNPVKKSTARRGGNSYPKGFNMTSTLQEIVERQPGIVMEEIVEQTLERLRAATSQLPLDRVRLLVKKTILNMRLKPGARAPLECSGEGRYSIETEIVH